MLYGRADETAALHDLLVSARDCRGAALVVRGEAGIGKSSLVTATAESATDFTVLSCVGVESEHAWSYAGLQALLRPLTGHLEALSDAHQCILSTVLGLSLDPEPAKGGSGNDRFVIGVAVLSLLAEAAAARPVLCLVDDAHWLDPDSADVLRFVARRLTAEPVAMVFAARDGYAPDFPAPGLNEITVGPLDEEAAARLLGERFVGLPQSSLRRLLATAEGNPLALLELPPIEADARLGTGSRRSTTTRLKQAFGDRIDRLPDAARTLLLLIAADDTGDSAVVLAAAERLGAALPDLAPAEADDLVRFRQGRFEFGHPLIRSSAYEGAPTYRRLQAHQALAAAFGTDDPQYVLHLAAATTGPDDAVAEALERAAECAGGCGGHAVEYATFERAAAFTADNAERGRRLMLAAESAFTAGNTLKARDLAAAVGRHSGDREVLARAEIIGASVAYWTGDIREASRLWTAAAENYTAARPEAAGYPLFRAVELAWQTGDFDSAVAAADRAEALRLDHAPWVRDLAIATAGFNRSCAHTITEAVRALRRLIDIHLGFGANVSLTDRVMVTWWQLLIGDSAAAERSAAAIVRECRAAGAAGPLPTTLVLNAITEFRRGRWSDAEALAQNAIEVAGELGHHIGPVKAIAHVLAPIAALRGDGDRARVLSARAAGLSTADHTVAIDLPLALLDFTAGHYEEALDRLLTQFDSAAPGDALTHVPVAVEAAVRAGTPERVETIAAWFTEWADANGVAHWQAMVERCRGLLADEPEAGAHFERAAALHREDLYPFEAARTDLIWGTWLRRARRVNEAKTRLRAAAAAFEHLGAEPWSDRVRRELRAAGDAGSVEAGPGLAERLTPQELQVVRLAAAGLSNREIGEQLYLSPRTAGYHLYKAYPKLGVASRNDLVKLGL